MGGTTIFEGMGRRTTKINTTFFLGNEGKPYTIRLKPEKLVFRVHFHPYLWFYWARCFQKQWGSPMSESAPTMWISWKSVQNCDLYRKLLIHNYIDICIYKYINIANLYSGTSKTKTVINPTSPTHPHLKSSVSELLLFPSKISLKIEQEVSAIKYHNSPFLALI